eukprot:GEMP01077395.1.p1 GENE.GEMP01077395.1~~GEMP01077395.1.p1  ORF type:complete len:304 (+),score=58.91 GEMP01077395.1:155-1066(+)
MRDADYYAKCSFGGILSCGITHAAVVTLDVHKCRSQARPDLWPKSLPMGVKKLITEEGLRGMRIAWVPTFFGYGAQGMFKFGLNEFFQDVYAGVIGGRENLNSTAKKMAFQGISAASAEFFADIALCPFEMTKVKMQVELPVKEWAPLGIVSAMKKMGSTKAETGYPFGSLKPLWGRQIPYTVIKFVVFYQTAEFVYRQLEKRGSEWERQNLSKGFCLGVTFACGYWAGIFCAISTQPMDNLVSMKGNPANAAKSFGQIASEAGVVKLFTQGLGTRILMVGTLTGLQWWIYGSFKSVMGFGTQ